MEHRVSNYKVAGSMPVLGINVVVCKEKTFKANFLTGTLCGVEDKHRSMFHNGISQKRK